ncbi:hypothetical protein J6590_026014 [Homalodisca vitripennis]|nr:hypothetical protein J6590_026014 [Homalodisca vitripennis]
MWTSDTVTPGHVSLTRNYFIVPYLSLQPDNQPGSVHKSESTEGKLCLPEECRGVSPTGGSEPGEARHRREGWRKLKDEDGRRISSTRSMSRNEESPLPTSSGCGGRRGQCRHPEAVRSLSSNSPAAAARLSRRTTLGLGLGCITSVNITDPWPRPRLRVYGCQVLSQIQQRSADIRFSKRVTVYRTCGFVDHWLGNKKIIRLVSDTVSDLTPGIWSHIPLKRSKENRRRRSSKRNICIVWTSVTPIK